jgi:hypothetical protein
MPEWLEKCSIALLQICYIFFTLGMDMLTGKNAGDIINLNSEGMTCPSEGSCKAGRAIREGRGVVRLESKPVPK